MVFVALWGFFFESISTIAQNPGAICVKNALLSVYLDKAHQSSIAGILILLYLIYAHNAFLLSLSI